MPSLPALARKREPTGPNISSAPDAKPIPIVVSEVSLMYFSISFACCSTGKSLTLF